jgi:serine protease Do
MNNNHHLRFLPLALLVLLAVTVPIKRVDAESPLKSRPEETKADSLSPDDWKLVHTLEKHRIDAIQSVIGSVVAIYGKERDGGGSGVIIHSSGIALTNHHVIKGAGVEGWGGIADGKLYRWKLIGTDPGGDVAIIQLEGKDKFPFTPLGDSDTVRVGDWALAMGNPFILTEDQSPTITMGIVSGIKRYQPGIGGTTKLVYGNCIQVDSSINPGNSGGPLFNLHSRVIGINGRGSFKDRGRVNVGLGYAISANQIKNFIPELLATKLAEHGTLDANFTNRHGAVICSTINSDSPVAKLGLRLGDELLEFEGETIADANQFMNLICTLPGDWPAILKVSTDGAAPRIIHTRLLALPYPPPPKVRKPKKDGKKPTPAQQEAMKKQQAMVKLLSAAPGTIRLKDVNQKFAKQVVDEWKTCDGWKKPAASENTERLSLTDTIKDGDKVIGKQELNFSPGGEFTVYWNVPDQRQAFRFDGEQFFNVEDIGEDFDPQQEKVDWNPMALRDAIRELPVAQALAISALLSDTPFEVLGKPLIDGSDKSDQQNAWRLLYENSDNSRLFAWLSMYDDAGLPAPRLSKIATGKDADLDGGVMFSDWEKVGDVHLPMQRKFITGIAETETLTIENTEHQWTPADEQ